MNKVPYANRVCVYVYIHTVSIFQSRKSRKGCVCIPTVGKNVAVRWSSIHKLCRSIGKRVYFLFPLGPAPPLRPLLKQASWKHVCNGVMACAFVTSHALRSKILEDSRITNQLFVPNHMVIQLCAATAVDVVQRLAVPRLRIH